ncbi:MAG TPA: hypothetical protein VFJ12_10000 [Segeticoccus sp.]|nr:hypothetical protein [Segeticoccus sp.]
MAMPLILLALVAVGILAVGAVALAVVLAVQSSRDKALPVRPSPPQRP